MGATFIAPQGTYTAPAKLITKEITENGTYDATDDSANGYSSVTVNVEGGGGSSDFSTAEVTITNNASDDTTLIGAVNIFGDKLAFDITVDKDATITRTAVLYKNTVRWVVTGTATVTGSATVKKTPSGGTAIIITGDCTITIS